MSGLLPAARAGRVAGLVAAALALAGCKGDPREARRVITVDEGSLCAGVDASSGVWESSPWAPDACEAGDTTTPSCCWVSYPGKTALEIHHSLGRTPRIVAPYLSFQADGASSSPASGDTALVLDVTSTTVTVANGTNQDFFLRLALQ